MEIMEQAEKEFGGIPIDAIFVTCGGGGLIGGVGTYLKSEFPKTEVQLDEG